MSTASLPSYRYEVRDTEHLLARRRAPVPRGNFTQNTKSGGLNLQLTGLQRETRKPEYNRGDVVRGALEIKNAQSVASVEVKVEGSLELREIAEGGTAVNAICLNSKCLWSGEDARGPCPDSLEFELNIPMTFFDGKSTYMLPPNYEASLDGVPGFTAQINYSITATVISNSKRKVNLFGPSNLTVKTPIVVNAASRPPSPLPTSFPTRFAHPSEIIAEDWTAHSATVGCKHVRGDDIAVQLFLPSTRVFCLTEPIPFRLFFLSSAFSLAQFLPCAPESSRARSSPSSSERARAKGSPRGRTRIQLLRQTSVDVRSIAKRSVVPRGNNTDIWKTEQVGEGEFRRDDAVGAGGGQDWMSYYGEVRVDRAATTGSFRASGLQVRHFIVLSMNPPDPSKSPFSDLRLIVPVQMVTHPWSAEDYGFEPDARTYADSIGAPSEYEYEHETSVLTYDT